jgi:molybdopterin biosynthesis enzyme MoaB
MMNAILDRAIAAVRAKPKRAITAILTLSGSVGAVVSPDFRDWLLDAGPVLISIIFGA